MSQQKEYELYTVSSRPDRDGNLVEHRTPVGHAWEKDDKGHLNIVLDCLPAPHLDISLHDRGALKYRIQGRRVKSR